MIQISKGCFENFERNDDKTIDKTFSKMLLFSIILLVSQRLHFRCRGSIHRKEKDYGSIAINIKRSNENSSRYGTLKAPLVMLRALDYVADDDRRSLVLCNTAFNEATDLMIDTLFKCVFDLLPTEALQTKLMETSVFRKSAIDTSQVLQINVMLRSLVQRRLNFIRGLDHSNCPVLLFSLSSNIPSLLKPPRKCLRKINMIITFNETGIQSSNAQNFTINDLIYLLKHDKVNESLGNDGEIQEWMHISDQISKQKLFNQLRCGIQCGGATIIFICQFLFCILHSRNNPSTYLTISLAMTKFGGWCVGMALSIMISLGIAAGNPCICCPMLILVGITISVQTVKTFCKIAIDNPAFNGVVSGTLLSVIWLSLLGWVGSSQK